MFTNDMVEQEEYDMRYAPTSRSSRDHQSRRSRPEPEAAAHRVLRGTNPLFREESDDFQNFHSGQLTRGGSITQALTQEGRIKKAGRNRSQESLSPESSDEREWADDMTTVSEAAVSLWTGYRVTLAHCVLFLLSSAKIAAGLLWIEQPAGAFVVASGVIGVITSLMYGLCRCCAPGGSFAYSSEALKALRWQTLTAQILGGICIPPSAILDGMYMSGLFREGLLSSSTPAAIAFAALSVLQSASFLVVFLEAMEARRLLRYEAFSESHSRKKLFRELTASSLV